MSYRPYAACAAILACAAVLLTPGCPGNRGSSTKSAAVDQSPPERPPSDLERIRVTALLACVRDGAVWLMDGQGNHRKQVKTPGQAIPESLSWASDGSRLAFWTSEDDRGEGAFSLYAVDPEHPEGPLAVYKTTPGLGGDRPVFAPGDTELIAAVYGGADAGGRDVGGIFAERYTRNEGLLLFPLSGREPERLLPDRPTSRGPLRMAHASPDGTMIVAIGGKAEHESYLALVDLDQGTITEQRERPAVLAQWSTRTKSLAYLKRMDVGDLQLHLWTPGEDLTQLLAEDLSEDVTFSWSPSGTAIAYADGERCVHIQRNQAGSWPEERSELAHGSVHRWPTWAPTGDAVVFEFHPSTGEPSVLRRDALVAQVSAGEFFEGATRPLFAPR